jgi:hypothetical protein
MKSKSEKEDKSSIKKALRGSKRSCKQGERPIKVFQL